MIRHMSSRASGERELRMDVRKRSTYLFTIAVLLASCTAEPGTQGPGVPAKPRGAAADGQIGDRDPDTSVAALNDAEWKAACSEIGEALNERELSHGPCILMGLLGKAIGLDCAFTYSTCTEAPPEDTQCDAKPADCTATLREIDSCMISHLVWLAEQTRAVDCSSSVAVLAGIDTRHVTPECQAAMTKCPSLEVAASDPTEVQF